MFQQQVPVSSSPVQVQSPHQQVMSYPQQQLQLNQNLYMQPVNPVAAASQHQSVIVHHSGQMMIPAPAAGGIHQQQMILVNGSAAANGNHDIHTLVPLDVAPAADPMAPLCIRSGCTNQAVTNTDWEDEYCSNECVITHCRDIFASWVQNSNGQPAMVYPTAVN